MRWRGGGVENTTVGKGITVIPTPQDISRDIQYSAFVSRVHVHIFALSEAEK
jgi:ribosomal protein L30E